VRVVLSVDMEGISQLAAPREILSCRPEYWTTGKPRMEADTAAAALGLLDAGADEVIVLDNHGSGNPENVSPESLPAGCRLETWNVFDLPGKGLDAMYQVGYHARGGTDGFISHTYVPGLRIRVAGELISESHGRAWAAGVPLIGITGNDVHRDALGSLADTPYLVVQETLSRGSARPAFERDEGLGAIRAFAAGCLSDLSDLPPPQAPDQPLFEASMPNGAEQVDAMVASGWRRTGEVEFTAELGDWSEARAPLAAAMGAAMAALGPDWVGATSAAEASSLDPAQVGPLTEVLADDWCSRSYPEWYASAGVELPPAARAG
jgi:D-aminopeptidase